MNGADGCRGRCSRRWMQVWPRKRAMPIVHACGCLIRDKLSGIDVPFDIRVFIGTVWADYLTRLRQVRRNAQRLLCCRSEDHGRHVVVHRGEEAHRSKSQAFDDDSTYRSWLCVPEAPRFKCRDEKMKCFLSVLYDLHMMAMKPDGRKTRSGPRTRRAVVTITGRTQADRESARFRRPILYLGTWLAFEQGGTTSNARLSWISPWRATYIFASRSGSVVMVFSPEELAWEMSTGRVYVDPRASTSV